MGVKTLGLAGVHMSLPNYNSRKIVYTIKQLLFCREIKPLKASFMGFKVSNMSQLLYNYVEWVNFFINMSLVVIFVQNKIGNPQWNRQMNTLPLVV